MSRIAELKTIGSKPYDMSSTFQLVDVLAAPRCRHLSSRIHLPKHVVSASLRPCLRGLSSLEERTWTCKLREKALRTTKRERYTSASDGHTCIRCEQNLAEQGRLLEFINAHNVTSGLSVEALLNGIGQKGSSAPSSFNAPVENALEKEAWDLLREAVVTYCGEPVGTIAAKDPTDPNPLNYDQVFIRDFIPSAVAFLLKGETEIVRNFLLHTLQLQVRRRSFLQTYVHGFKLVACSSLIISMTIAKVIGVCRIGRNHLDIQSL